LDFTVTLKPRDRTIERRQSFYLLPGPTAYRREEWMEYLLECAVRSLAGGEPVVLNVADPVVVGDVREKAE
jgi:hypothetical protein